MSPVTPGEVLREDFMEPLALSANALAKALHVPPNRITAILNGTRSITADTALRLARYFDVSVQTLLLPWGREDRRAPLWQSQNHDLNDA
ncbi:HigA family addiction module antitoxin, partial [Imhoffiella purpurea]|uniref:HigA family addiction module antitoxin n=1 Tax=Imhoffiella purpurea TaxID=1249627 RepID=UPI0018E05CF4